MVGQRGELPHDDVADPAQRPEREGDREEDRDGPRHPTPLEEPRKRRQCEAEEHRQGQGLQHLGRERHRGDDRQDEEGHDGRMVHRGLALTGHGGVPCGCGCHVCRAVVRQDSTGSDRQPGDQPGHQADAEGRYHCLRRVAADQTLGTVVAFTDLVAHLVGVLAGGLGRMRDRR